MKNIWSLLGTLFVLAAAAGALWYGWYQYVIHTFPDTSAISDPQAKVLAARGQLGDMFGGINALFTALLLAGALYTILLQQRQLAAMHTHQMAQERESKEIARLQAMTALVAARSTLVRTRYQVSRDMSAILSSKTVDAQFVPSWQMLAFANAEAAGRELQSLIELAEELNALVEAENTAQDNEA